MASGDPGPSESWDPGRAEGKGVFSGIMRLLRIEHTIFSLPFAYVGALASGYGFTARDALLMALAVLGLRSASMSFNNIADRDIDARNPRTAGRPLVTGAVSLRLAWLLVLAGLALFHLSSLLLNRFAFALSWPISLIALSYPYAKRLHAYPHIHLGLSLGLVVFGGAVAASGDELSSLHQVMTTVPWDLVVMVALWVAGFDIIYSVQDAEFDRRMGLGSIPAWLGVGRARWVAIAHHLLASLLFVTHYARIATMYPPALALLAAGLAVLLGQHFIGNTRIAFNMNLTFPFIVLGLELIPALAHA